MNELEFMECDSCRKKPGSPYLCEGCLHNRNAIYELQQKHEKDLEKQSIIRQIINL